jgi:hypothetical protein
MSPPDHRPRSSFAATPPGDGDVPPSVRRTAAGRGGRAGRIALAPLAAVVAALAALVYVVLLPICGIATIAEAVARSSWAAVRDAVVASRRSPPARG